MRTKVVQVVLVSVLAVALTAGVAYGARPAPVVYATLDQVKALIAESEARVMAAIDALAGRVDANDAADAALEARVAAIERELHPVVEQSWTLAEDYLARPDETRPVVKDADGNDVWFFKHGSVPTDPTTYVAMDALQILWSVPDPTGYFGWCQASFPESSVLINGSGRDEYHDGGGTLWRAGKALAHPGFPALCPSPYTVTEWNSPFDGFFVASITLTDIHPAPGYNGVEFWVLKNDTILEHVTVGEGGSGTASISPTAIGTGDSIYVVLGPGTDGNYGADSTQVDFTVSKVK